jgi:Na+-transporting methylmalonyl-CoA/oxaloacetate decarboxylase gamma subunit
MTPLLTIPPVATTEADFAHSHSFMDALPHLGGMVMVLITLTCLWALTSIVANFVSIYHNARPAASPATVKPTPSAPQDPAQEAESAATSHHSGISPEVVAIISAAIACMGGTKRRIISIKPADTSWEKAGRQAVLMSHRIR